MQALRVAVTGRGMGPDLMEIIQVLGKKEVVERINFAISTLKVLQA